MGTDMPAPPLVIEHALDADVSCAFAWHHRTDISTWNDPPAAFALDGPFAPGSHGTTIVPGQEPIRWWIREVRPERQFLIEIPLTGASVWIEWRFEAVSDHRTRMTQRIALSGENAAAYTEQVEKGFGATIASGMARLAKELVDAEIRGHQRSDVYPARDEATEYYFGYIEQVPPGTPICEALATQLGETLDLLRDISDERSLVRYAADKWSIREVISHLNDTERLFVFRAFWFARGFDSALPSFDQDVAIATSAADERTWPGLIDEFRAIRESTVWFFRALPGYAWDRRGVASGNTFSVRALAYLTAGHLVHHLRILRERYLQR
ncbi:MAG TPA: DinB family protein [Vicinamibacterales bacterium]|nr:DinB family protein [Vicinamibacterales bacterium]